jgi:hypothetical protein
MARRWSILPALVVVVGASYAGVEYFRSQIEQRRREDIEQKKEDR